MIRIAIDGPSGAGKSSLAKGLAAKLGINYLDTGALYRTVGYAAREAGIGPDDRGAVVKMLENTEIRAAFEDGVQMMYLNGRPLGDAIRENDISAYASAVSAIPEVRAFLLETQRDIARRESVVMDGRDIGSCVLKDAICKIYLTASVECRALRRMAELQEKGVDTSLEIIKADISDRDYRDMHRDVSPLVQAEDAVYLDSSDMGIEEVTDKIISIFNEKAGK